MNRLEQAADNLRNGWCTGDLVKGDKFCAVGALGVTLEGLSQVPMRPTLEMRREYAASMLTGENPPHHEEVVKAWTEWEDQMYSRVGDMPEVKVLAEVIEEQTDGKFNHEDPVERIYQFNDEQAEATDVIAMFEKAAMRWDEQV